MEKQNNIERIKKNNELSNKKVKSKLDLILKGQEMRRSLGWVS
jgi:hypothetical protein